MGVIHITDQRISRTPRIHTCHTCAAPVLTALDANRCALTVTLDPYALTPAGEVWALQDGRRTYQLTNGQLNPRDRWNIPGRPPGPDHTILPSHRCHQPTPHQHRQPPTPTPAATPNTEEIPF